MDSGPDEFFHLRKWMSGNGFDEAFQKRIRMALSWLAVPEREAYLTEMDLHNLALGYAWEIEQRISSGTWKQVTEQLGQLEASAKNLARDLQALGRAAQTILYKEACTGKTALFDEADIHGLFVELRYMDVTGPPIFTAPENPREVEQNPPQGTGAEVSPGPGPGWPPRSLATAWTNRAHALAEACKEGARIARAQTNIGGRRRANDRYFGTPEMQLLKDCAVLLKTLGRDDSKAYRLAKVAHQLATGEMPKLNWASETKRVFVPWWKEVRKWLGLEAKAPKEIREKINQGPHAGPRRPARN